VNLAPTITHVFLCMNVDIDIILLVSLVAIAINAERKSGSGQSTAGKKCMKLS